MSDASETPPQEPERAAATAAAPGSTEAQRRAKVERLRAEGINPYPHSFEGRTKSRRSSPRTTRPSWARASTRSSPTG